MSVPPLDTVGPSSAPAAEKGINPTPGGASNGVVVVEEVLDQKDTPASTPLPSWDEMMEILKRVPCFSDAEPPSTKMLDFFPLTKRISVNLGGEPPVFVSARLPCGTPESGVSCIQLLQNCIVQEIAEVVNSSILPHFLIMSTSISDINSASVVTSNW